MFKSIFIDRIEVACYKTKKFLTVQTQGGLIVADEEPLPT